MYSLIIGAGVLLLLGWLLGMLGKFLPDKPESSVEKPESNFASYILIVLVLLFGWGLFSYIGLLPKMLAMPLPYHYEHQVLLTSVADVKAEFEKRLDEQTVPKGTFDQINETSRYQASLRHYINKKNKLIFMPSAKDRSYSYAKGKVEGLWKYGRQMGIRVQQKNTDFFISGKYRGQTTADEFSLYAKDITYYDDVQRTNYGFIPDYLSSLLKKQHSEKIAPREYAILLEARVWGQIAGWFPESGTALIYDGEENAKLRVYNVEDNTFREASIPEDYRLIGFVNEKTAACIRPDQSLVMCDVDSGPIADTVADMNALSAGIYVNDSDGSVYLSAVHTKSDGTSPYCSCWQWTDGNLVPAAKTLCYHEINTEWNYQEADVFCQDDLVFAVFPEETSINYIKFDKPWE